MLVVESVVHHELQRPIETLLPFVPFDREEFIFFYLNKTSLQTLYKYHNTPLYFIKFLSTFIQFHTFVLLDLSKIMAPTMRNWSEEEEEKLTLG